MFPKTFSSIRSTEILLFIISKRDLKGMILIDRSIEPIAANKLFNATCLNSTIRNRTTIYAINKPMVQKRKSLFLFILYLFVTTTSILKKQQFAYISIIIPTKSKLLFLYCLLKSYFSLILLQ